jgi:methionine-rich copper-binding protein CopC
LINPKIGGMIMKIIKKRVFIMFILAAALFLFHGTEHAMAASTLSVVNSNSTIYNRTIGIDEDVKVIFNSIVQNGTGFSNITLMDSNNIRIPVTCTIDGQTLSINPTNSLDYGSYYTIIVPYNAVKNEVGNTLNEDFTTYVVTVGDYIGPRTASTIPVSQAREVETNSTISIKFTEKIKAGHEIEKISLIHGNNIKVPINIGINGDTLIIKPLLELDYNTFYYIYIPYSSITDMSGNISSYIQPLYFTTKSSTGELKVNLSIPSKDAKYISINNPIQIFYNERIFGDTGLSSITVKDKSGNIPINVTINSSMLYIAPKNGFNFAYNTTYTVVIPQGAVKGLSGAAAKSAYTFNFTTEAQMQNPKIIDASPQNGITDAAVDSTIKVTFSENIKQGETIFDIILKDENNNIIPTDLSINNNILNIRPKTSLDYNTTYTYTIPYGAVTNSSSVPLKQDYEYKFKTDIERFNPYIYKSFPANGALNTTVDGSITILFNEEIQKGENFDFITLRDVNYNELPIVKELSDKTIKILPANNLNFGYNTKYILTIPYGAVKDIWKNTFASSSSISFTTGYERFSPVIKFVKPSDDSSDVQIDAPIEITFNDKMLKGDNFDNIVLKDSLGNNIKCKINVVDDKTIIKPESNLENNSSYSLLLPVGGVKDYWDGVSKYDFLLKFKTCLEKIPPMVKSITPVNKSRNIDIGSAFTIVFSENVIKGKVFNKITLTNGNMKNVPFAAEIINNTLTIKPVKPLDEVSSYTLRIPAAAITDKSENQLKEDIIVNFTTRTGEANKNALTVNEVKYNADYSIFTIAFNKNVTYGSNIKRLLLKDQNGRTISTSFGVKGNTLTINPRTKLTSATRYTFIIPAEGVKDSQGKNMINQYSFSFITK